MWYLFLFFWIATQTLAEKRIVNGVDAQENEFPFMVSLQYNNSHFCGGTILSRSQILTAAHCICSLKIEFVSAVITPLALNNLTAVSIQAVNATCLNFDILELINDVAIMHLATKIPIKLYHPVVLAPATFSTKKNQFGHLTGWGLTVDNELPNTLQKVEVMVYNDEICAKSHNGIRNIKHHICAGWPGNGRGSCQGDSGGPLLVGNFQVGIISLGLKNCRQSDEQYPKISARITNYLDWIQNHTIQSASPNAATSVNYAVCFVLISVLINKYLF